MRSKIGCDRVVVCATLNITKYKDHFILFHYLKKLLTNCKKKYSSHYTNILKTINCSEVMAMQ